MDARARLMKRVKTSCPLRSGGAANGQCPKNPMACASQDCIALLLRLTFDREEAAALLSRLAQVEHPEALEVGALYRRLAQLVRADERAARTLDSALEVRLNARVAKVRSSSMVEVARLWSNDREKVDGLSAAAFLWTVARAPGDWWRQLESVIVQDVKYMSARSLMSETMRSAVEAKIPMESGLAT